LAATQGVPIPDFAVSLVGDVANALFGSGDNMIAQVARSFTLSEVIAEARKPRHQARDVSFTFLTDHRGGNCTPTAPGQPGRDVSWGSVNLLG